MVLLESSCEEISRLNMLLLNCCRNECMIDDSNTAIGNIIQAITTEQTGQFYLFLSPRKGEDCPTLHLDWKI